MRTKTTKIALLGSLLLLAAGICAAQNRSGEYERGATGTINIRDVGRGKNRRLILWAVVGQPNPGCSGSVEGKAKFVSKTVAELVSIDCESAVDEESELNESQICRIKFIFSGRKLIVRAGVRCLICHGASCEFDGIYYKLSKKRAVVKKRRPKRK